MCARTIVDGFIHDAVQANRCDAERSCRKELNVQCVDDTGKELPWPAAREEESKDFRELDTKKLTKLQ